MVRDLPAGQPRCDGDAGTAPRRGVAGALPAPGPRRRAHRGRRRRRGLRDSRRCRCRPRAVTAAPDGTRWAGMSAVRVADGAAARGPRPRRVPRAAGLGRRAGRTALRRRCSPTTPPRSRCTSAGLHDAAPTRAISTVVACSHAAGHLERQLDPRPRRPCHRLAGTRRRRRAGHAGDQVRRRPVPDHAVRGPRIRGGALRLNQWNGVAIASRSVSTTSQVGFDGQPTWSASPDWRRPPRHAHSAPRRSTGWSRGDPRPLSEGGVGGSAMVGNLSSALARSPALPARQRRRAPASR